MGAYRKIDVKRAIEAAKAADFGPFRVDFRRNDFSIIPLDGTSGSDEAEQIARRIEAAFPDDDD